MKEGEEGRVVNIDGGLGMLKRLAILGVRKGRTVKKVVQQPFRGPIIVEVNGNQIGIGRGMASKIYVDVETER